MYEIMTFPAKELPERAAKFLRWAREMAVEHNPGMVGFVMLSWGRDGSTSLSADAGAQESPIPRALLPAWVAEVIRRDLVTEDEVRGVLRELGLLAPGPPDAPA